MALKSIFRTVRGLLAASIVTAYFVAVVDITANAASPAPKPVATSEMAAADDDDVNDPLETVNRAIFGFNTVLHESVLDPVAEAYNENVPANVRASVGNFLENLSAPITFVNNLLQGNLTGALDTFTRFLINSTVGMGGLADVVSEVDGEPRNEDFGQTLGVWGIGEGFYLVLPIFGPSSPRDIVGKFIVDPYFDPVGLWVDNTERDGVKYSRQGAEGIDELAGVVDELQQIKKTSVDYYAAIRSLYRQKRKSEINNGESLDLPPIPNLGYDLDPEDFNQPLAGNVETQGAAK